MNECGKGKDLNDCRILAVLVQSLYSLWWDIVMDWDLGHVADSSDRKKSLLSGTSPLESLTTSATPIDHHHHLHHSQYQKFPFLLRPRRQLFPNSPLPYYACILADTVLRCSWLFKAYYLQTSASPDLISTTVFGTAWYAFLLQVLEIWRRWMWTFLRIENKFLACQHDE